MTATRVNATARVGLDGGLYRSTDAGASWSFTRLGVLDAVAIDPATPSILYAVGDRGVLKSSDAGANWTSVHLLTNDDAQARAARGLAFEALQPR